MDNNLNTQLRQDLESDLNYNESPEVMDFIVALDCFAGPLDLLLHLVQKQEVPIEQVEMAAICQQYLEIVIHSSKLDAQDQDLGKLTEYLVVAASLIAAKSQALLPNAKDIDLSEVMKVEEDSSAVYEELRARLIEFEKCKKIADNFVRSAQLGVDVFTRKASTEHLEPGQINLNTLNISSLTQTFVRLLGRIGTLKRSIVLNLEHVSIVSTMLKVIDIFKNQSPKLGSSLSFKELLRSLFSLDDKNSKNIRVHTLSGFIAMLELAKRGILQLTQESESADINLNYKVMQEGIETENSSVTEVSPPSDQVKIRANEGIYNFNSAEEFYN